MTQLTLDMLCIGAPYNLGRATPRRHLPSLHWPSRRGKVGSVLNSGGHSYPPEQWRELVTNIHEASIAGKGIPTLYGVDAIHGATYTYGAALGPQQIALAATWDTALVRAMSEATAREISACGIPWNFAPVLDVGRDPRWPRFWETFGEDVKLVGDMGESMVRGFQEGESRRRRHPQALHGVQHTLERKKTGPQLTSLSASFGRFFLPSFRPGSGGRRDERHGQQRRDERHPHARQPLRPDRHPARRTWF